MNGKVSYRQQFTRCGKQRCRKCQGGEGHGPYWYAYWSENGHTVSKYIGLHLPHTVETASQLLRQEEQRRASIVTMQGASSAAQPAPLQIYLLGQFRVERHLEGEWLPVDQRIWQRRRVRALLGCLLSSPGRRLGREQAMEAIWPDLEVEVAANRLNGAVHELRQILEPDIPRPASSRLLRLESDILQLADRSHIWVDAEAFEGLLKDGYATSDLERAEILLEQADMLYRGSYLIEELYSEWATQRRDALHRRWVGLLLNLAKLRMAHGAFPAAIEALDRLRTAEPANETALQLLMLLLTHLDRRGEALQLYSQYESMLKREYSGDPLPETRSLYTTLKQGHTPDLPVADNVRSLLTTNSPSKESSSISTTSSAATGDKRIPIKAPPSHEKTFVRPIFHVSRQHQSPLVGRERELTSMRQVLLKLEGNKRETASEKRGHPARHHAPAVSQSAMKQTHFVLLQGEPGIGKTRLAEELSIEADKRGWAVAWSRAYEQEGAIPYRPWTELLRILLHTLSPVPMQTSQAVAPDLMTLAQHFYERPDRLAVLFPEWSMTSTTPTARTQPSHSQEQERLYLWEATLALLTALSKVHPLLLVLDDLHWTDESSIELLSYLTHHLREQRIVIIGTCRDGELAPIHKLRTLVADLRRDQTMETLPIHPLTQSQIESLLAHIPHALVQQIQSQAAGNPFFAEELARYVETLHVDDTPALIEQQGSMTYRVARLHRSLPEAIAVVLERRLGRLSSECQVLLGKAAVLGGAFELSHLLPMASNHTEDSVLDLLEEALRAGLLIEEGVGSHIIYHFWHPLIVNHLYDRLSAARRAQLHRKAADTIKHGYTSVQQEKVAAAIVYHLSKGGGNAADIAYYAELAANSAYSLAAYSEAQHYYLQAIQAILSNTGLSLHLFDAMSVHEAIQTLTQMPLVQRRQLVIRNPLRFCRLLEHVAECCSVRGDFEDARALYEYTLDLRTGELFQHSSQPLLVEGSNRQQQEAQIQALLWREIGNTWTATGEYARAYACYQRGKEVMTQANVTTGAAWACLHLQYGTLLRLDGYYQEAHQYFAEALAILEQEFPRVSPSATPFPPSEAVYPSTIPSAQAPMLAQKELPTRTERALLGEPLELGYVHEQLGVVAASMGQLNDGLKYMNIASTIYEQHELFTDTARIYSNLGAVYIMKGELAEASSYLQRAFELAERSGDIPNMAFATINLGDITKRTGNLLEAENWFRRSLSFSERINDREHMSWCCVELATVQQDLGQIYEATRSLLRAISIGRAIKSPRCIRYALVALGELRITQAIIVCQLYHSASPEQATQHYALCHRLLARAKATLQRAVVLGGLEAEAIIDGKLLLATISFLQEDMSTACQIAQQAMEEARENETARIIGRAQRLLGMIFAAQGRYEDAEHSFEQALQLLQKHGLRMDYARTLRAYGKTLFRRAKLMAAENVCTSESMMQRAIAYLSEAQEIFTVCQAPIDLRWAEQEFADQFAPSMPSDRAETPTH